MADERWIEVERHYKLNFLAEPHPYKILYGGRGGLKSWGIARQLLIDAASRPLKTLCCRETMNTIADSVHALLSDQIGQLGLSAHFDVQKAAILGINGSQFAFAGLRHNVTGIKSYEGFDRAWVEEAHNVSKASWNVLIPTIRKEGSEIWISFNPELETDDTYQRFILQPPPGAVVVKTSYRDNIWLSDKFRADMEHMRATNPDEFNHVYEGLCVQNVEGAIYAAELYQVDLNQRITKVDYDPRRPVFTFWDIGDRWTAIWFAQSYPWEYRLIDYHEDESVALKDYLKTLDEKPYKYGKHYLPHDAKAKQLGTGKSIEEQMREAGFPVGVVARLSIADGINAARTIFPQCWFDGEKCADGLQALRHYRWAPLTLQGTGGREPLHDWASHPADAFRYFAVGIKQPREDKPKPAVQRHHVSAWS